MGKRESELINKLRDIIKPKNGLVIDSTWLGVLKLMLKYETLKQEKKLLKKENEKLKRLLKIKG